VRVGKKWLQNSGKEREADLREVSLFVGLARGQGIGVQLVMATVLVEKM
jgi:hypothetical protein